jgi:hypothetical protein
MMLLERFGQRPSGVKRGGEEHTWLAGMTDGEDGLASCDHFLGEPLYPEIEEYVDTIISLASCCLPQVMNLVGGP